MGKVLDLENALPAIKTWILGLFSNTNPKANGTAAPGTAKKAAREDHVHPLQTTVSGNAGTATKLKTARTIDGVDFDGSAAIAHYGLCETAADVRAKTVSCTGFKLVTGAWIAVRFLHGNTADVDPNTGEGVTLNVNNTGAIEINFPQFIKERKTYLLVYDGQLFREVGDSSYSSYSDFTPPNDSNPGNHGLVPAPPAKGQDKVLTASGFRELDIVGPDDELIGSYGVDGDKYTFTFFGAGYESTALGPVYLSDSISTSTDLDYAAATPKAVNAGVASAKSYTDTKLASYATKASPTFTGTPKAPTAAATTNDTQIATTAFVQTVVANKVSGLLNYKGSKTNYSDLPSSGNTKGDVWNVVNAHGDYPAGTNYAWDGSTWDPLGGAFSIDFATAAEVTASLNS